jgi:hypothetical protein
MLDAKPDHGDVVFPGLKVLWTLYVGICSIGTLIGFLGSTMGKYEYFVITGLTSKYGCNIWEGIFLS